MSCPTSSFRPACDCLPGLCHLALRARKATENCKDVETFFPRKAPKLHNNPCGRQTTIIIPFYRCDNLLSDAPLPEAMSAC